MHSLGVFCRSTALWLLSATCTLAVNLAAAEPAALARLDPAEDEFHFVVVGDTQFDDPVAANRLYDDLRWLRPAFVIQVGDMIDGYAQAPRLRAQWQRFRQQIAPLETAGVPFLPVAGNHDLYGPGKAPDQETLAVYEQIWGRPYYDFRYRNAHLLVLNSDPVGAPNAVDEAQLAWLEARLQAAQDATHRLAFLHRPPAFLTTRERLIALFKRYGVSHVFYGHHHHFHHYENDGITFVMTNGSGHSDTMLDQAGAFQHLLQVSVRDDTLTYAVLRADSIEAPGYVVPEDNYDLFALRRALNSLAPAVVAIAPEPGDRWLRYRTTLELTNPSRRDLILHLTCSSADGRVEFDPQHLPPVTLTAQASRAVPLVLRQRIDAGSEAVPSCTAQFLYQVASGSWHPQSVEIPLPLPEAPP